MYSLTQTRPFLKVLQSENIPYESRTSTELKKFHLTWENILTQLTFMSLDLESWMRDYASGTLDVSMVYLSPVYQRICSIMSRHCDISIFNGVLRVRIIWLIFRVAVSTDCSPFRLLLVVSWWLKLPQAGTESGTDVERIVCAWRPDGRHLDQFFGCMAPSARLFCAWV